MAGLTGRLVRLGLVLALAGGGGAAFLARAFAGSAAFYHAYLVAFLFFLGITLGAIFFVLLHHLTRAGWSVTVRRLAEGLAGNIYLMLLLALPLLAGLHELYEWIEPEFVSGDHILRGKSAYLNEHALLLRLGLYFGVWIFLAWFFRSRSIRQDKTGDARLSKVLEKVSAPGMIALGFTLSFAMFDLVMALNPHWFSTIFGVYMFAGMVLSFLAVVTLLALWLQRVGRVRQTITHEHYHDLGKMTFAFTFFWGYIAFSQYMLIWYANMPEETQFFIPRQLGFWAVVGLILAACHLAIPFGGLLSRHAKRKLAIFSFWAVWLLLAHLLDLYWLVMPNLFIRQIPELVAKQTGEKGLGLPEALSRLVVSNQHVYQLHPDFAAFGAQVNLPLSPACLLLTASLVAGMGGLYIISTAWCLRRAALIPLKDPRLPEALAFENV